MWEVRDGVREGDARQEGEKGGNKINATTPKVFLCQIQTHKETTSIGQVVGTNSVARQ